MIAVDTNVLVYAHREELPEHAMAARRLRLLAESSSPWGVPSFCAGEFLRVVTHRRILAPPSPPELAIAFIDALTQSPSFRWLSPEEGHWSELRVLMLEHGVTGNLVFDAQIAAVCLRHGAVLLTADRDFAALGVRTERLR